MAETPPLPARKVTLAAGSLQRPETVAEAQPEARGALSFCGRCPQHPRRPASPSARLTAPSPLSPALSSGLKTFFSHHCYEGTVSFLPAQHTVGSPRDRKPCRAG